MDAQARLAPEERLPFRFKFPVSLRRRVGVLIRDEPARPDCRCGVCDAKMLGAQARLAPEQRLPFRFKFPVSLRRRVGVLIRDEPTRYYSYMIT
jgi:hypothetical protein